MGNILAWGCPSVRPSVCLSVCYTFVQNISSEPLTRINASKLVLTAESFSFTPDDVQRLWLRVTASCAQCRECLSVCLVRGTGARHGGWGGGLGKGRTKSCGRPPVYVYSRPETTTAYELRYLLRDVHMCPILQLLIEKGSGTRGGIDR